MRAVVVFGAVLGILACSPGQDMAVLRGVLVDDAGDPVSNAIVRVEVFGIPADRTGDTVPSAWMARTTTAADGSFDFVQEVTPSLRRVAQAHGGVVEFNVYGFGEQGMFASWVGSRQVLGETWAGEVPQIVLRLAGPGG